mmetsp:Transcript_19698/g.64058  ORF Transcript_19698/g.64058 Transcript_19698/m.64058 type:complete len:141 (-) Transcript_19698:189-611(-)
MWRRREAQLGWWLRPSRSRPSRRPGRSHDFGGGERSGGGHEAARGGGTLVGAGEGERYPPAIEGSGDGEAAMRSRRCGDVGGGPALAAGDTRAALVVLIAFRSGSRDGDGLGLSVGGGEDKAGSGSSAGDGELLNGALPL